MTDAQAIQMIITLADGINPVTGEIYDAESPYFDQVISALLLYAAERLGEMVQPTKKDPDTLMLSVEDELMYEMLRSWRARCAKRDDLRLYQIFTNETLKHMALYKPKNKEQLLLIKGVGDVKLRQYGDDIIDMMTSF